MKIYEACHDKYCFITIIFNILVNPKFSNIVLLCFDIADQEARDYRSRTPLHVAVDMGRILAADYLISLPKPAEVRVSEKNGNMAISAMIKTMPCVVCFQLE